MARLTGPAATLDAAASGTTARFITAAATLADGPSTIDGTPRMRERPIGDLVAALTGDGRRDRDAAERGLPPGPGRMAAEWRAAR